MFALDLVLMPLSKPLVVLNPHWLIGEFFAVLLCLLPAFCLARWTLDDSHLRLRSALQILLSGLLFLFFLPELAFALKPGNGWQPLLQLAGWKRQVALQIIFLLAIPGISAVFEFAERGAGTPIPYDPPKRLVTSGIYRYFANPMQLSCIVVMLAWTALLRNGWFLLACAVALAYTCGLAEWDERQDLSHRFGDAWNTYRSEVRNWRPRWRPYHAGPPAHIYIAATCTPCSQIAAWLRERAPIGLAILDAESLPPGSIRRMRYYPNDGAPSVEGIRAFARALEHIHLGWALAGAALRLPFIWPFVQLSMDAAGFGPRVLEGQDDQEAHCNRANQRT
jgi:protein-S-isoprenylcysteine O-methyltransferase Ste14